MMYIYGELFKPDKLIPFCVWIKSENWKTGVANEISILKIVNHLTRVSGNLN